MSNFQEQVEKSGGHVPEDFVYGPVRSRRFGQSLGVSMSAPGYLHCGWNCPYCQLGKLPRLPKETVAPLEPIQEGVSAALKAIDKTSIDVICIAGSGEPTDHPQFADFMSWLKPQCDQHAIKTVILTNGDGLREDTSRKGLELADLVYVKWDPNLADGSWSLEKERTLSERINYTQSFKNLRIQTLLFIGPNGTGGNCGERAQDRWLTDMAALKPVEIQLTTVERDTPTDKTCAVECELLEEWQQAAQNLLPAAMVSVHI